jgi:hypothetical protein
LIVTLNRLIVQLLRQRVADAGGQSSWSRKTGIHRSLVNRVSQGRLPPTGAMLKALQLETVYVQTKKAPFRGHAD